MSTINVDEKKKNKMTITTQLLQVLKDNNLSLYEYYLLYDKYHKSGMVKIFKPNAKVYKSLYDKELLSDKTRNILIKGRNLLESIWQACGQHKELSDYEDSFNRFWKSYPRTDAHAHFPATRNIRSSKAKTKLALIKVLKQDKYTIEDILRALDKDVKRMKALSKTKNELRYMKNPVN